MEHGEIMRKLCTVTRSKVSARKVPTTKKRKIHAIIVW